MLPRAVVFDVDGVLVQSMHRHCEAHRRVFARRGVVVDERRVYLSEGKNTREVVALLCEAHGVPASEVDVIVDEKQREFEALGVAAPYPGAVEAVEALRAAGVRVALASGTSRRNLERHLADVLPLFEAAVTAEDVRRTKPDPEPYLAALARLGVAPADAVVVENAPLGVRAARAAGARVVAVTTTLPARDLEPEGPDLIVADVAEAVRAILAGKVPRARG